MHANWEQIAQLREQKNFSPGDIEKRTGLLRRYISRVENGHTVPAIETLEKMASALDVPTYQLFYDGQEPAKAPTISRQTSAEDHAWGASGKDARMLKSFCNLFDRTSGEDRQLLVSVAQKMARRTRGKANLLKRCYSP